MDIMWYMKYHTAHSSVPLSSTCDTSHLYGTSVAHSFTSVCLTVCVHPAQIGGLNLVVGAGDIPQSSKPFPLKDISRF